MILPAKLGILDPVLEVSQETHIDWNGALVSFWKKLRIVLERLMKTAYQTTLSFAMKVWLLKP